MVLHGVFMRILISHSYTAGTEHAVLVPAQARNQQVRSAVTCSTTSIRGNLHPAEIARDTG